MPGDIDPQALWRHIHQIDKAEEFSLDSSVSDATGYEEWPSLKIELTQGARLTASNGKIVAFMGLDGTIEYMPGMRNTEVVAWEAFGVHNPAEQVKLAQKVETLINSIANRNYR